MLQSGESLYLANISLTASLFQRISSEPLWVAVGNNSPVDFAEWVANQISDWMGVVRSKCANLPQSSKLEIIATNTRIITPSEHKVYCVRVELTVREIQNTRHDKLVRYIRNEAKIATQTTVHAV